MIIPLVSVLMPVYNAERYLKESIESILNQTLTDFEFIIINDGSNDRSDKIISSYLDARIVYIKNDVNNGVTYCLNQGLALCKGKFVARMDADDISTIDRLNRQVSFFEENINIGVCGSNMLVFGEMESQLIYPETHFSILEKMFYENPIAHPTVMLRRSLLFENNLNYPAKYQAAEDYGLWILLRKITKFHNIQEFLVKYRYHTNQVRAVENKVQYESIKKIQIKLVSDEFNYLGGFINKRFYYQIIFKNKRFSFFPKLIIKAHIFLKYKF